MPLPLTDRAGITGEDVSVYVSIFDPHCFSTFRTVNGVGEIVSQRVCLSGMEPVMASRFFHQI